MKRIIKSDHWKMDDSERRYFQVEKDTSYVQEDKDSAIEVFKYYVVNPNGDGDGFVEVSVFEDGAYQIESVEDAYNAANGALKNCFPSDAFRYEYSKDPLESMINTAFKEYVEEYLS